MKYRSQLVRNKFSRDGQMQLTIIEKCCMMSIDSHFLFQSMLQQVEKFSELSEFLTTVANTGLSEDEHQ